MTRAAVEAEIDATLARFDHILEQVEACLASLRQRERAAARLRRGRRRVTAASAA